MRYEKVDSTKPPGSQSQPSTLPHLPSLSLFKLKNMANDRSCYKTQLLP